MRKNSFLIYIFAVLSTLGCSENPIDEPIMVETGEVTGRVLIRTVDTTPGEVSVVSTPSAAVQVSVQWTAIQTTTISDGTFYLPMVPEGTQRFRFTKSGYSEITENANVIPHDTTTIDDIHLPSETTGLLCGVR